MANKLISEIEAECFLVSATTSFHFYGIPCHRFARCLLYKTAVSTYDFSVKMHIWHIVNSLR